MLTAVRTGQPHQLAAITEIDEAFIDLTAKDVRDNNQIWLEDGKPIIFGPNDEFGVVIDDRGAVAAFFKQMLVAPEPVRPPDLAIHESTARLPDFDLRPPPQRDCLEWR